MTEQKYVRTVMAGGYYLDIEVTFEDCTFKLNYNSNSMGTGKVHFILGGRVILNEKNYKLVNINKYNEEEYESGPYLDVLILDHKTLTDDAIGITSINSGNTPSFPSYFNCVINLNDNVWEGGNSEIMSKYTKNIQRIDKTKLISVSESNETSGWSWEYNEDTNKIGVVHKIQ